jgi:hypothetical protein
MDNLEDLSEKENSFNEADHQKTEFRTHRRFSLVRGAGDGRIQAYRRIKKRNNDYLEKSDSPYKPNLANNQ